MIVLSTHRPTVYWRLSDFNSSNFSLPTFLKKLFLQITWWFKISLVRSKNASESGQNGNTGYKVSREEYKRIRSSKFGLATFPYICVGFCLLVHLTCDLSQAEKFFLQAEQIHKMTTFEKTISHSLIFSFKRTRV